MYPIVHCSTIFNSQDMGVTKMPIHKGIEKDVVHIYNGILLSYKKEWNNAICTNISLDGPRDDHSETVYKPVSLSLEVKCLLNS